MVSGRGAGHLINFAFSIHSCLKDSSFRGKFMTKYTDSESGHKATYLSIRAVAAQTCVLRRIRTDYLWCKEQFVHLHGHHAKKMLENSWSLRVELPQAEGATFAGQNSAN